ncbi:hypothetical protein EV131_12436 [Rhizobium laguerreae]|uniref:Uncharacterized protein n=1 Tax=Rhizobium laguerreae TaxID=1076926 RepID=A0AAX2QCJ0_9HYPH|nr:hypothetical protein EV131_12436 [Rhizobium laguerreae]
MARRCQGADCVGEPASGRDSERSGGPLWAKSQPPVVLANIGEAGQAGFALSSARETFSDAVTSVRVAMALSQSPASRNAWPRRRFLALASAASSSLDFILRAKVWDRPARAAAATSLLDAAAAFVKASIALSHCLACMRLRATDNCRSSLVRISAATAEADAEPLFSPCARPPVGNIATAVKAKKAVPENSFILVISTLRSFCRTLLLVLSVRIIMYGVSTNERRTAFPSPPPSACDQRRRPDSAPFPAA